MGSAQGDSYLYQPIKGEDLIVDDGLSFSAPFIAKGKRVLSSLKSLSKTRYTATFPSNYEEDAVQLSRFSDFDAKDWLLVSLTIDSKDYIQRLLLINASHHEEGVVISYKGEMLACFFRGFMVKEMPSDEPRSGDDFLEILGIMGEEFAVESDYDDDEDAPIIEVARPQFVAFSKKKIVNLGGSAIQEVPMADDEDEEDIHIEVERPAFVASSSKKPRDLGYSGKPRPRFDKKKNVQPRIEQAESEPKDISNPAPIEVERPAFTPASNKKPLDLGSSSRKRQKPRIKKEEKPAPIPSPVAASKQESKEVTPPTPLPFEPSKQAMPANLSIKEEKGQSITYDFLEDKPREEKAERAPQAVKEEREWVSFGLFKMKPKVSRGERAILNAKGFEHEAHFLEKAREDISVLKNIRISKKCVFVPEIFSDGDHHFEAISSFDHSKWNILAVTIDKEEDVIYCLLDHKEELGFCLLLSFKHHEPHIVLISTKGASLDDRALPYYSYEGLREVVYGK